jgi:hypothetical protein
MILRVPDAAGIFSWIKVQAHSRAVFVSALSFHLLDAAVTAHWGTEPCPSEHLPKDYEDRKKSMAELFVSGEHERAVRHG